MQITVVTGPFLPIPPGPAGAVEKIWFDLCQEFAKKNHDVELLSRSFENLPSLENLNKLKISRSSGFKSTKFIYINLIKDFAYSLQKLSEIKKTSHILVINCFWLPFLATRFRAGNFKVVVNVARMPKRQMGLYSQVNRLAVVSTAVKNAIVLQTPAVTNLIKIIPNPVNEKVFNPPSQPRVWNGKKIILYAGRIHPEKGLEILVNAFREFCRKHKDIELRMIGPWEVIHGGGGLNYREKLLRSLEGFPGNILKPVFDPVFLVKEYHQAHLFCYPSVAAHGESFGVAPLEAMATGLPVVVSNLDCFKDFIENGQTGFIFNHQNQNPEKILYSVMEECFSNPLKTISIGEIAAKKAKNYSVSKIADLYLSDFQSLFLSETKSSKGFFV